MTNQYIYRGFDIRQDGKDFDIRRHYSAKVHKGFPADFIPAVRNAENIDKATKELDAFIEKQKQPFVFYTSAERARLNEKRKIQDEPIVLATISR